MELWRTVWRDGFAPQLSTAGLAELRDILANDHDGRLLQGATTAPPPIACLRDRPVESACVLGLCAWLGEGCTTVGQVEEYFARACAEADRRLGEPAACRHFLNWFDDAPRHEMRRQMLDEVTRALGQRSARVLTATIAA